MKRTILFWILAFLVTAVSAVYQRMTGPTYPLRVIPTSTAQSTFHGSLEAKVTTTIACAEVDNYGNAVRTTVTPSLGGVVGRVLVTTQTFVGALANCKNAFGSIRVARGLNREGQGAWRRYREQMAPVLPLLEPWVRRFGYLSE